ncbi:type II toxin-antitoxin system HicA family toxin [Bdellovibrionota bacterium FG-2]
MPISGKRIIKILLQRGWVIKSQRGSHVKLSKDGKLTEVPLHGNHDLGRGLIRAIEKQTGEKLL